MKRFRLRCVHWATTLLPASVVAACGGGGSAVPGQPGDGADRTTPTATINALEPLRESLVFTAL